MRPIRDTVCYYCTYGGQSYNKRGGEPAINPLPSCCHLVGLAESRRAAYLGTALVGSTGIHCWQRDEQSQSMSVLALMVETTAEGGEADAHH